MRQRISRIRVRVGVKLKHIFTIVQVELAGGAASASSRGTMESMGIPGAGSLPNPMVVPSARGQAAALGAATGQAGVLGGFTQHLSTGEETQGVSPGHTPVLSQAQAVVNLSQAQVNEKDCVRVSHQGTTCKH